MSPTCQPLTRIKTYTPWKRRAADTILDAHLQHTTSLSGAGSSNPRPIRIVCISDTHNKRPTLPLGDVLIHAGDLTEMGSFDEVQRELFWLSSLPHKHKIFVAGNHDVLLDDAFLLSHPERRYGQEKTRKDLDWGDVKYLQDAVITVEIDTTSTEPGKTLSDEEEGGGHPMATRKLSIFGSPWTPQYGTSAFQYRPDDCNHWQDMLSSLDGILDIVVTHGPPRLHLDKCSFHRAGCPFLAQEIRRLKPRLHVFGHIHAAYGQETVALDAVQGAYEEIMTGWAGWSTVVGMAVMVAWARMAQVFRCRARSPVTTFVNAAVVGGPDNQIQNEAVVVEM